ATTFDYLAQGQSLILTYSITATDEHSASATQDVTVTITGTNDGPVAVADTATTDENTSVIIDVLANDTDADLNDTHTLDAVFITSGNTTNSTVTISNNKVIFDPHNDFKYLATGQTATVTIEYIMYDSNGAFSNSTGTITITGISDDIPALPPAPDDFTVAATFDFSFVDHTKDDDNALRLLLDNWFTNITKTHQQLVDEGSSGFAAISINNLNDTLLTTIIDHFAVYHINDNDPLNTLLVGNIELVRSLSEYIMSNVDLFTSTHDVKIEVEIIKGDDIHDYISQLKDFNQDDSQLIGTLFQEHFTNNNIVSSEAGETVKTSEVDSLIKSFKDKISALKNNFYGHD
ncbi:MAG: VCBS domain-containing protein, partial [Gammaproteobacteria bacterium]|nr:VCBS domain-containing protein [Gammaproteobacteria bacterium]